MKQQNHYHHLHTTTTADSSQGKPFVPKAKSKMDARVEKERPENKTRLQKQ